MHILTEWNERAVFDIGWRRYLKKMTGIDGGAWKTTKAIMLLDIGAREDQCTY